MSASASPAARPSLADALARMPLVAILRGLTPDEALPALEALTSAGLRVVEVPLNSPEPLESLKRLAARAPADVLIGAGTVLAVEEVHAVAATGAKLIVAPNVDAAVIGEAKRLGLVALPGVMTPSEAFAALDAGADALKLFPAEVLPPPFVKALRAVLPASTLLLPVGGIAARNIPDYAAAGADGFGIGSALYKPGLPPDALKRNAEALVAACRNLRRGIGVPASS